MSHNRHRRPSRYATYRRRAWLTGWTILVLAGLMWVGGYATAQTAAYQSPADQVSDHVSIGGCAVRFDTLNAARTRVVPRLLGNSVHQCVGMNGVHPNSAGSLVVDFDTSAGSVISMLVNPDPDFARWGIICGPSVSATYEVIACYRNGHRVRVDSLQLYSRTANLWLIATWWS